MIFSRGERGEEEGEEDGEEGREEEREGRGTVKKRIDRRGGNIQKLGAIQFFFSPLVVFSPSFFLILNLLLFSPLTYNCFSSPIQRSRTQIFLIFFSFAIVKEDNLSLPSPSFEDKELK